MSLPSSPSSADPLNAATDAVSILSIVSSETPIAVAHNTPEKTATLCVPHHQIGKVIGKGGETIFKMQKQSGAHIQIEQLVSNDASRNVIVSGSIQAVTTACELLHQLLETVPHPHPPVSADDSSKCTLVVDVHTSVVGKVIGRGGETIKMLQQMSGARVLINQNFPPDQPRKVEISGSKTQVETASKLLQEVLTDTVVIKMDIVDKNMIGVLIGKRGATMREIQQLTKCRLEIDHQLNVVVISGARECVEHARDVVQAVMSGVGVVGDTQQQQQQASTMNPGL
eukprot:c12540_g1_i1.p1 GENE.c12540_g1_i1~~c12540_g1_i1.p1  ORF type:complete len:294 (-),score=83.12 c12540_g1_i1:154-1005(-)